MEFKSFKQDDERKVLQLKVFWDIFQYQLMFLIKGWINIEGQGITKIQKPQQVNFN